MQEPFTTGGEPKENKTRRLRHDIRNQLSNINLAVEQLKYEIPDDAGSDSEFLITTIAMSCAKINVLLDDLD
jgi:nitrogen fixation/metabolism regulation signal transduction histidine kinase